MIFVPSTRVTMRRADLIRTISESYSSYPVFRILDREDSTCTLFFLVVVRVCCAMVLQVRTLR